MFDWNDLNFDFDEDGILDSHAELFDSDGDGIEDALGVDLDGDGTLDAVLLDTNQDGIADTTLLDTDGDGIMDTSWLDTNRDGIIDQCRIERDTDGDGVVDQIEEHHDYDQDGVFESVNMFRDSNHDGIFDEVVKGYDSDHDGQIDTFTTHLDEDGDGKADTVIQEQLSDQDGDGVIDTYRYQMDADGNHAFEVDDIYNVDVSTGEIELEPIGGAGGYVSGTCADELRQFDPDQADMDAVSGAPAQAMEKWEFQGNTGRCALYSQKFVIEELTGHEIDMEDFAQVARENGWFDENSGTPLLNMNKMLDYYNISNEMSFHNDISDIQECLESRGKVIVSIDADEIWYGESNDLFTPGDGANHAVEVIGIDNSNPDDPMVILNDSGNPNGCGEMVPLDTFLDAWEDGDCQMISCF